jgi:uncharacterized protein
MNNRKFLVSLMVGSLVAGGAMVTTGCRKNAPKDPRNTGPAEIIAPELLKNGLGSLPGAVYQVGAKSSIHWQPWTQETFRLAKEANRLLMVVVTTPQHPGFQSVLGALEKASTVSSIIHENYVPILVDGEASRELGLLTAELCAEIKRPLQLPLFIWMTPDANPVAWIPIGSQDAEKLGDLFSQYDTMVAQTWRDDPNYVKNNSTLDNTNRRERLDRRRTTKSMSDQPAVDVVRGLRQLASLYDPFSRTFDETGGLFPASSMELLATTATRPGVPKDVRDRCMETTRNLLDDLLPSAMFDPLDGGVFNSRRGVSWSLPSFVRDCLGQARAAFSLLEAHRATGNPLALQKALGLIAFAEANYSTEDGLFSAGLTQETKLTDWLWSVEEVKKVLGPEDADWWIRATGMDELGNLASEVDPLREFFRANTLGLAKPPAVLAAELGQPVDVFTKRFDAARAKLLAVRNARLGKLSADTTSHAYASFRMASAYASAFSVTGDEKYREKAVAVLTRCREAFGVGPRLRLFSRDTPPPIGSGRAFLYALALQSTLDVYAISPDERWLLWSEDLATTAAELFIGDGFIKECPDEAVLIDLPITDYVMLFEDSSGGLFSAAESRLTEIARPLLPQLSEIATPIPNYVTDRPVLHTDLLLASLVRHFRVTVLVGDGVSGDLKKALDRMPPRTVQRRPAKPDEAVPAGTVRILLADGVSINANTAEALQQALLPSS